MSSGKRRGCPQGCAAVGAEMSEGPRRFGVSPGLVAISSWSDVAGKCFFWFRHGLCGWGCVLVGFFEIPAPALRRAQLADELPVEIAAGVRGAGRAACWACPIRPI